MAQARGKFLQGNALVLVRIQPAEDCCDAPGVPTFEWRKGSKLFGIEASVFTGDLSKLFLPLSLQGGAASVTCSFAFFQGKLSIAVCVKLGEMGGPALGAGGPTGLLRGLALLLINLSIFVKVKLGEHFGKLTVTEGSLSSGAGIGKAKRESAEQQVIGFHVCLRLGLCKA